MPTNINTKMSVFFSRPFKITEMQNISFLPLPIVHGRSSSLWPWRISFLNAWNLGTWYHL